MFYVPCIVDDTVNEYYFKVSSLEKVFSSSYIIVDNKKVKIKKRGIPRSLIDIFSENYKRNFKVCESV